MKHLFRALLIGLLLVITLPALSDEPASIPKERISKSVIHIVGSKLTLESPSALSPYNVVFEDNGTFSTFYALDFRQSDNPILDRLLIFDDFLTRPKGPFKIEIAWSTDGMKAALLFRDKVHGVFDFAAKRGYTRTNLPPANAQWSQFGHEWDEAAVLLFQ